MAKILYSVSGEGHGHATRSLAVISELQKKHEVIAMGSFKSYTVLKEHVVTTYRIPGFSLSRRKNRISYIKTALTNTQMLLTETKDIWKIRKIITDEKPDIIITDFEPFICRFAKKIPVFSIDNQQLIRYGKFPLFTTQVSNYLFARNLITLYYARLTYSFATYFAPIALTKNSPITQIGAIIRPEVLKIKPTKKDYIVVYVRSEESAKILSILTQLPQTFHVFGTKAPSKGNVKTHGEFSNDFLTYLANAKAVICTAGLSLISEALYLQKPIFAIPERQDFEQYFNAFQLQLNNYGKFGYLHKLKVADISAFLENLGTFQKPNINPNGATEVADHINAYIKQKVK